MPRLQSIRTAKPIGETFAFQQGKEDYIEGVSRYCNPFRHGGSMMEQADWAAGWAEEHIDHVEAPTLH